MYVLCQKRSWIGLMALAAMCTVSTGCQTFRPFEPPVGQNLPRELKPQTMPPYIVEPPDVINIHAESLIPKGGLRIKPLDTLLINVTGIPGGGRFSPIQGNYVVNSEGLVNLRQPWGNVLLAGLTLDEAEARIAGIVGKVIVSATVNVALLGTRAVPQIDGDHLVTQDGTITLGSYGTVFVAGKLLPEIKEAIEALLLKNDVEGKVTVTVSGYNSKYYYVIIDAGGAAGYQILRAPITGRELVLDVIAGIGGLGGNSSEYNIWIARPNTEEAGCDQIMPINLRDMLTRADTSTNYQLMPGDRLFIKAQSVVAFTNYVNKLLYPFETVAGAALLGITTYQSIINSQGFFGFFPGTTGRFFGGF